MSRDSSGTSWHRRHSTTMLLTVAGAFIGYFVFHPYAMLVHVCPKSEMPPALTTTSRM